MSRTSPQRARQRARLGRTGRWRCAVERRPLARRRIRRTGTVRPAPGRRYAWHIAATRPLHCLAQVGWLGHPTAAHLRSGAEMGGTLLDAFGAPFVSRMG
jgi:hypothetical protein